MKAFIKIKTWLIHKLGGYTKQDVDYLNNQQPKFMYKIPKIEKFRVAKSVPRYSDFNPEEMSSILEHGLAQEIGTFIVENHLYKVEQRENYRGDTEYIYTVMVVEVL